MDQNLITFLLLCSERECLRFEDELASHRYRSAVEHFDRSEALLEGLKRKGSRSQLVVVIDMQAEGAWALLAQLKSSPLRRIPLIALCDESDVAEAYDAGANATLPRNTWAQDIDLVAPVLGAMWIRLARVPAVYFD